MELWFTEKQTESFGITAQIRETLVREKTDYQDLAILDTVEFGRHARAGRHGDDDDQRRICLP